MTPEEQRALRERRRVVRRVSQRFGASGEAVERAYKSVAGFGPLLRLREWEAGFVEALRVVLGRDRED